MSDKMCNKLRNYSLKEISEWQDEISAKEKVVSLPSLQRGFVWKANQIEALWDSILRGYPIGNVLMSFDDKTKERLLLDGQQRSTSIALGFFNPISDNRPTQFFSLKNYLPSVWIDLQPRNITQGQKFLILVLTKSHPWGYQITDNTKPLSMSDRRKAFEFFKTKQETNNYIELLSTNISPWDSYFPVPLALILNLQEELNFERFKEELLKELERLRIKTKHSDQYVDYKKLTDESLKMLFGCLKNRNLRIPEIQVKAEILKEDDDTLQNDCQDPTLFIRLNSSGTQITGEELIYSVYKATFPKSKDLVENIGATYIAPSKIINIFSRLANCELNEYKTYVSAYNINSFRKAIRDEDYRAKLEFFINGDDEKSAKKLIDIAVETLKQGKSDFPNVLLKQFIISDIDLFFILIAYIKKNSLSHENLAEISSNYVYLLWFSINRKKIYNKLYLFLFKDNLCWKEASEKLIKEELVLPLLKPNLLRDGLLEITCELKNYNDNNFKLNNEIIKEFKIKEEFQREVGYWIEFVDRIRGNNSMLLFAQRKYLNEKFKEFNQIESIDDTNRPWDYDHIYPKSWVYNKESINLLVRNWVNTIGNYRALSYDDNRSESNHKSPKERFEENSNRSDSFVKHNDFEFWNNLDSSYERIKHQDINKVKIFMSAVIHRICNIYEEWYNEYYTQN